VSPASVWSLQLFAVVIRCTGVTSRTLVSVHTHLEGSDAFTAILRVACGGLDVRLKFALVVQLDFDYSIAGTHSEIDLIDTVICTGKSSG
jgi:hypothetical protein